LNVKNAHLEIFLYPAWQTMLLTDLLTKLLDLSGNIPIP